MALPYLVKYIYNNGTDEVIRRGKKIHAIGNVELIEYDDLMGSVTFRVKDDAYSTYYKVHISKFKDPKTVSLRCGCPYNLGEICRHESASLFQLQEMVDRNMLGEKDQLVYDQRHTVIKMKQLELKTIRVLASPESFASAEEYLRSTRSTLGPAKDERVTADMEYEGEQFKVVIQKNEERNFDTSCTCDSETKHPLCVHKAIALLQLLNNYGPNYFDSIRNWDKEKDKLLALYGYSITDDINGKFEFTYKDGKPFLRVLDTSIKRIAPSATQLRPLPIVLPAIAETAEEEQPVKPQYKLGIVISYNPHQYPYIQVDAVQGEANDAGDAYTGKTEKLDLARFVNTEVFDDEDKMLVQQVRKLLPGEVSRYLNRNSPFSGIWENIIQQHDDELPEETRHLIIEYLHPKYKKLFTDIAESHFTFYLPARKTFITSSLQTANCSINFITPDFTVSFTGGAYEVVCTIRTPMGEKSIADNAITSSLLYQAEDQFYLWQRPEDVLLVERFMPSGKIVIAAEDWNRQLQQFVLPLSKDYNLQFSNVQKEEVKDLKPDIKLVLKERGDYLLFQPVFTGL